MGGAASAPLLAAATLENTERQTDGGAHTREAPLLLRLHDGSLGPTKPAPCKGGLVGEGAALGRPWLRRLVCTWQSGAQGHQQYAALSATRSCVSS